MEVYKHLPKDIQIYIGGFIPLWQRLGLQRPPQLSHSCYYNALRRVPKEITGSGNHFYHRRNKSLFEWQLYLDYYSPQNNHEYWIIKISMCRKNEDGEIIKQLIYEKFYDIIEEPSIAKRIRVIINVIPNWHYPNSVYCRMEYYIERRDSLPTRQACVDTLCDHMIELAKTADKKLIQMIKKK